MLKPTADGRQEEIYMIYLIFDCVSASTAIYVLTTGLGLRTGQAEELALWLNVATRHTLALKGYYNDDSRFRLSLRFNMRLAG